MCCCCYSAITTIVIAPTNPSLELSDPNPMTQVADSVTKSEVSSWTDVIRLRENFYHLIAKVSTDGLFLFRCGFNLFFDWIWVIAVVSARKWSFDLLVCLACFKLFSVSPKSNLFYCYSYY